MSQQSMDGPRSMSLHEASKVKKAVESSARAIENRIKFFQREEEKIWRDLEEVRRQAATIEEGRSRTLEKKLADRKISQARDQAYKDNRTRAQKAKESTKSSLKSNMFQQQQEKQMAGEQQRRQSSEILRTKRMMEAQHRLRNSERAVAIQRSQLEARWRINEERAERLKQLREEQEQARVMAEQEVQDVEARLPKLEQEEMVCLQRLQNSRVVTQSVLEELEMSLGARSPVTSLLRMKQRSQGLIESVSEAEDGDQDALGDSPGRVAAQGLADMAADGGQRIFQGIDRSSEHQQYSGKKGRQDSDDGVLDSVMRQLGPNGESKIRGKNSPNLGNQVRVEDLPPKLGLSR